ncbi:uncharacterized protein LOC126907291 isoform X2 [Daktulosphaira vitifoliae]|uniref:uncharacterized protein LOC126907291 isoform X2 n=1 Tax=Daktulosphaira vitifoliae TaxID=58002 RepID=UPI0021AAE87D|nr:uncharacterized protein LOC126907291 isoform X2 [Daktulosphaira vitifoliae]
MNNKLLRELIVSCVLASLCCGNKIKEPSSLIEDNVAAEDHEHHRIIIVVPKEIPHHVNHIHTYKIAEKGIPLIHSGKVVHEHKHSGKVAHDHGHIGKSSHSHKHTGVHNHQQKHAGTFELKLDDKSPMGHQEQGDIFNNQEFWQPIAAPKGYPQRGQHFQQGQPQQGQLHHRNRQQTSSPELVQFIPSTNPQGLGSYVPAEIVHGRHGIIQHFSSVDGPKKSPHNVYRVQLANDDNSDIVKHLNIDLANNAAKLQTADEQQPGFKTGAQQYNKVIGHGRAISSEVERELNNVRDVNEKSAGDGDDDISLSLEELGYRFGDGYKFALNEHDSRETLGSQEQDEEEGADEFKEPSDKAENEGNVAVSQAYRD